MDFLAAKKVKNMSGISVWLGRCSCHRSQTHSSSRARAECERPIFPLAYAAAGRAGNGDSRETNVQTLHSDADSERFG